MLTVHPQELVQIPAFNQLSSVQIGYLSEVMRRRQYSPGQLIFLEGEKADGLWFVFNGRVKIIKQSLHGRVQALCMMNRGKCFGSCPLYDMDTNPATAQAVDDVTLFILPESQLKTIATKDPELVRALLHIYSQRLTHLAQMSEVLATWTVQDRIKNCLAQYATRTEDSLVVNLTHEKLAALSGTVREVVTRHLTQLENEGIISLQPGRITIQDISALIPPCCNDAPETSNGVI